MDARHLTFVRLFVFAVTFLVAAMMGHLHYGLLIAGFTISHFISSFFFGRKFFFGKDATLFYNMRTLLFIIFSLLLLQINFQLFVIFLALHFALTETFINRLSREHSNLFGRNCWVFLFHFSIFLFILRRDIAPALGGMVWLISIPVSIALVLYFYYRKQMVLMEFIFLIPAAAAIHWTKMLRPAIFFHIFAWLIYPKFLGDNMKWSFHKNDLINVGLTVGITLAIYLINAQGLVSLEKLNSVSISLFIIHSTFSLITSELNPKILRMKKLNSL